MVPTTRRRHLGDATVTEFEVAAKVEVVENPFSQEQIEKPAQNCDEPRG